MSLFGDLRADALTRITRPTMITAIGFGVVGFAVSLWRNSPLAAVGIAIGIGVAILNLRVLGAGVLRVPVEDVDEPKPIRRLLRQNSLIRLSVITAVAIGLVLLAPPLGIGMVIGLVIFQISFVVNAGRVILNTKVV